MSDTESNFSNHSQNRQDYDMGDYISRTNSNLRNGSNPHSIFERTVEDSLNNTPLLMQQAQRRLSRTNSVVSFSNNKSMPISIDSGSRSNSNIYQSLSNSSNLQRRPSVMSSHRHSENFIAPSLDSTCQIINDNNTTIDDIQVEDHPLSSSLPSSPNNSIFSPSGTTGQKQGGSPGTSPSDYIKGPLSRRPSTIGLDIALGVKENSDQSPPLKLNSFSFSSSNNPIVNNNLSLVDSPLAQGNSPRLVRFQSYADVLSEEASNLRRPSFGNANNGSQLNIKPQSSQSSQDMLEFQFNKQQPSLLKRNSSVTISNNGNTSSGITSTKSNSQYYSIGGSPLSSPIFSNKQHPLKKVVANNDHNIQKDIFERVTPNDYKKYDSKEKSPFHQLSNKD
ncbi:hypothetical protein DAHU10_031640 [Hanseniaspora uvarum]|nr:hypothetical protein DAHU10_031640 [Hanseniaspora uvarum]